MNIWLVKEGEPLPVDGKNTRLMRMGILAGFLAEKGHSVVWWESTFSHQKKQFRYTKDVELQIEERVILRLIHARPYRNNISITRILHQRQTARAFTIQARMQPLPDLILASMPTINIASSAVKFGKEHNIPVLVDIRDAWPDVLKEYFPAVLFPLIQLATCGVDYSLKKTLAYATGIIGISEPFLHWGLQKARRNRIDKDGVFPLGYPDRADKSTSGTAWKKMKIRINPNDFIVLYSGTFSSAANLEHIIRAAELVHENDGIQFVCLGDGATLDFLREKARGLKHIIFPGRVSWDVVASLAMISNAGLIPYRKKTQFSMACPNKFAEYLSFGLPILLFTDGIMRKTIYDSACGLHYDSPEDLVKQIRVLKADSCRQDDMRRAARHLYEKQFTADQVYGDMIAHFEYTIKRNIVSAHQPTSKSKE